MGTHYGIMIVVAVFIIAFQARSLFGTLKGMKNFSKIFGTKKQSIDYILQERDGRIVGFHREGDDNGNSDYQEIESSINNYIGNNQSIDFQIIKGTIDASCDSLEEDVQTQIPIPLYLGLAGTMAGIIIGVGNLWLSGALANLTAAAVTTLLGGVAIAMVCSIVGLIMTTFCTWRFKGCKLHVEQRKSALLAWLQQHLLPEVATDDLQAMGKLANQLRTFNVTFSRNTTTFGETLQSVRTILDQQNQLAQQVAEMGRQSERMANNNSLATSRLEQSSEKLQRFNDYLDSINGYVDEVHRFTENFREETLRLQALEEIRDFFKVHRDELEQRQRQMSKQVAEFDRPFKDAMTDLRNSMTTETNELQKIVGERTRAFEETLSEQKRLIQTTTTQIIEDQRRQLDQLPQAVRAINGLQNLPAQINNLLQRVEQSNRDLIRSLRSVLPSVVITGGNGNDQDDGTDSEGNTSIPPAPLPPVMPRGLKWTIAIGVIVTALACAGMCAVTCYNTWGNQTEKQGTEQTETAATPASAPNQTH